MPFFKPQVGKVFFGQTSLEQSVISSYLVILLSFYVKLKISISFNFVGQSWTDIHINIIRMCMKKHLTSAIVVCIVGN